MLQSNESRGEADIGHQLAGELQERSVNMVRPEMYRHHFGAIEDVGSLAGVGILMRWLVPGKGQETRSL